MTASLKSNHHPVHDRLFVLDLDRCLITTRAYDVFNETVVESGMVDLQVLADARKKVEDNGKTFDAIHWLRTEKGFSKQKCEKLLDSYVFNALKLEKDALLAPGARRLLAALDALAIPHFIMTYGGHANQKAKIEASGLGSVPYLVVSHPQKSQNIQQAWNNEQQYFEFEIDSRTLRAHTVVLVDDKATAFTDLAHNPHTRGYRVKAGPELRSQKGDVPENVTTVSNLEAIITAEHLDLPS